MEVLVRLALEKFKNIPPNLAVKRFLESSFNQCFGELNSHVWRQQYYWTE